MIHTANIENRSCGKRANKKIVTPERWSWSLDTRDNRLCEVLAIGIWRRRVWSFGSAVTHERWSVTRDGPRVNILSKTSLRFCVNAYDDSILNPGPGLHSGASSDDQNKKRKKTKRNWKLKIYFYYCMRYIKQLSTYTDLQTHLSVQFPLSGLWHFTMFCKEKSYFIQRPRLWKIFFTFEIFPLSSLL